MIHNGNSGDETLPPDLEQALRDSGEDMTAELGSKLNIEGGLAGVFQNGRSADAQGLEPTDRSPSATAGGEYRVGRTGPMRFRVLGPLEIWSENGWSAVGAAKWRSLLACLLLRRGQLVATESLIFELWGDSPPAKANNLVSIYVHRLQRLIGDSEGRVLVYRAPGYLLRIGPGDLDLQEFESYVTEGRRVLAAREPERAAALLTEALALWRGPLLADVPASALITTEAERTAELHLVAVELRIQANLACARSAEVIPELRRLVAENPIREGLWLLLMRALDESGRHAEALETYAQARQVISDELGVDPGAELQGLYAELLAAGAPSASARKMPARQERPARPRPAAEEPSRVRVGQAARRPDSAAADEDETDDDVSAVEVRGSISIGTFSTPPAAIAVPAEGAGDSAAPMPAQLPADIGDFTGRDSHVRHLCEMLVQTQTEAGPGAMRIAVVAGAAGLGKTTLAVHAAHQVRGSFPTGSFTWTCPGPPRSRWRPAKCSPGSCATSEWTATRSRPATPNEGPSTGPG